MEISNLLPNWMSIREDNIIPNMTLFFIMLAHIRCTIKGPPGVFECYGKQAIVASDGQNSIMNEESSTFKWPKLIGFLSFSKAVRCHDKHEVVISLIFLVVLTPVREVQGDGLCRVSCVECEVDHGTGKLIAVRKGERSVHYQGTVNI